MFLLSPSQDSNQTPPNYFRIIWKKKEKTKTKKQKQKQNK